MDEITNALSTNKGVHEFAVMHMQRNIASIFEKEYKEYISKDHSRILDLGNLESRGLIGDNLFDEIVNQNIREEASKLREEHLREMKEHKRD